ncbi:MAG: DNA cytosine methyltransferase [Oscillospiraceae bacterium]|nr:DNA cytosine methyltransferase [Oscillospiraceae bacterium]
MYTVMDLFCGIGGFSYGFKLASKFNIVLGVDSWDVALNTFQKNNQGTETEKERIEFIDDSFWTMYTNRVDVILAGPPCQGFSMSGKRDISDKRNNLVTELIRVVSLVKPKIVVVENVVGLLSMKTPRGKYVKEEIKNMFNKIGYKVDYKILTASDYGAPQQRKRVIFIASQMDNIRFPEPTHGEGLEKVITVGDAIR